MSVFEWFGESYFPGNVGNIKKRRSWRRATPRYKVLINFMVSLAMLAGFYYLLSQRSESISVNTYLIISAALIFYCVMSFFINPQPDYKNIGLGGTPIDHPFRISDDINRFLVIMKAMLLPGFFITRSLLEFVTLIRHGRATDMR